MGHSGRRVARPAQGKAHCHHRRGAQRRAESCRWLESEGYQVTYLKPDSTGMVSARQVLDAVREDTVLVSMMLVNNETGCVFPVAEAAKLLREAGSGALLHCDAVQGFLKVPCDPVGWGVDLMSLSAHKLGGPKGIGPCISARSCGISAPSSPGGGQEMGLRSGTGPRPRSQALPRRWSCDWSTMTRKSGTWRT